MFASKLDKKNRDQKSKKRRELKRDLLLLMSTNPPVTPDKYLVEQGYWQTSRTLLDETRFDPSTWEVPVNVDLELILQDFQDYFQFRYDRRPVLAKRREAPASSTRPSLQIPTKSIGASKNKKQSKRSSNRRLPQIRQIGSGADKENRSDNFQVEGQSLGKSQPKEDQFPLKGLPQEYMLDADLRGLAEQVKRDIVRTAPKVRFRDVVGLGNAKRLLTEALRLPRLFPQLFESGDAN